MVAVPLKIPEYLYALEYYRQVERDRREHVYTETVDDHGFVFEHDPAKRDQWLVRYTHTCAEEYFARARACPGNWLVHVYRLLDGERHHVVSIRMSWPGRADTAQ